MWQIKKENIVAKEQTVIVVFNDGSPSWSYWSLHSVCQKTGDLKYYRLHFDLCLLTEHKILNTKMHNFTESKEQFSR